MSTSQEIIHGDPDVQWGAGGFYNEGYVQRGSIKYAAKNAQAVDSSGKTVTDVTYDPNMPVSFEMLYRVGMQKPKPGDMIQVQDEDEPIDVIVRECEKQWEAEGFVKVSVTAQGYEGITAA